MTDKEKIKAIIKQYADKGERLLEDAYKNDECASTTGYWDGYQDCADGLLRELEDIQEEPVSEDLEDVARDYAYEKGGIPKGLLFPSMVGNGKLVNKKEFNIEDIEDAVIYGARWQKEQIIKRLYNHANIDQMVEKFEDKYKPEKVLGTEYYKRGIFDTIKAIKED